MSALDYCQRRAVEIRVPGPALFVDVLAWAYGDWAIHETLGSRKFWSVTHLPTGLRVPASFKRAEDAADAAADFQRLRNDWASLRPEDLHLLRGGLIAVIQKHGGDLIVRGRLARPDEWRQANGYAVSG